MSSFHGFWVILKNLTHFRKTMETDMVPRQNISLIISSLLKKTFSINYYII